MITEGQLIEISQRDSQPLLLITVGRLVSEKFNKIMWRRVRRMNATFGEVLREVLIGFLIMEPDRKWGRVRR